MTESSLSERYGQGSSLAIEFWAKRVLRAEQDRIEADRAYENAMYQLRGALRRRNEETPSENETTDRKEPSK